MCTFRHIYIANIYIYIYICIYIYTHILLIYGDYRDRCNSWVQYETLGKTEPCQAQEGLLARKVLRSKARSTKSGFQKPGCDFQDGLLLSHIAFIVRQ